MISVAKVPTPAGINQESLDTKQHKQWEERMLFESTCVLLGRKQDAGRTSKIFPLKDHML